MTHPAVTRLLDHRERTAKTLERLDAERLRLIQAALRAGLTRTEVASALGITRQGMNAYLRRRGHE